MLFYLAFFDFNHHFSNVQQTGVKAKQQMMNLNCYYEVLYPKQLKFYFWVSLFYQLFYFSCSAKERKYNLNQVSLLNFWQLNREFPHSLVNEPIAFLQWNTLILSFAQTLASLNQNTLTPWTLVISLVNLFVISELIF